MKILTRYILLSYLKNYLISLFVLIGLYVVLDMVFNFDEFAVSQEAGGTGLMIVNVAEYYFYQSFLIFSQLSGVITVVAAAFTFLRLARFNELTAMMAAGMHLVRVAAPAIFCAVILSLVFPMINQELIIPNIIPELTRGRADPSDYSRQKVVQIQAMQDSEGNLLFAANYEPPTLQRQAELTDVVILRADHDRGRAEFIDATAAVYNPQLESWELVDGMRITNIGLGMRSRQVEPVDEYKSNITPEEIALYRSGDFVNLLSTARINQLLERTNIYGGNDLLRVKHARLAQLLLNITMVLLAISSVLIREGSQLKWAVMKCLYLVGACMATIFICQAMADEPPAGEAWRDRWAALMAWLPIFIFTPLSVFLMDRVKT
jgi:lipopolysaccharide export LptBFGC system permease protein LptF